MNQERDSGIGTGASVEEPWLGSNERLPETEYPDLRDAGLATQDSGAGKEQGDSELPIQNTSNGATDKPEGDELATEGELDTEEGGEGAGYESPNFEQDAEARLPLTEVPMGSQKGRRPAKKVGRPRLEENVIGMIRRMHIADPSARDYVITYFTRIVGRLVQMQGQIYPEQDVQLLGNAQILVMSMQMREYAATNPAILQEVQWVSEYTRLQSTMQRSFKMLGLYAGPKTKPDRPPKVDPHTLLAAVRAGKR